MERYICIHGHFYQPLRENPWLEAIELQDSAYPYHDWNERITAECYAPNSVSRILDAEGRIIKLVNNYAKISFNFGPTLLYWLEKNAPDVYRSILEADRESRNHFAGHGSALAQPYNHMILPLANRRDRYTQIFWGIRDFEHRFQRSPEGMWLPETAVDLETLDLLAELGIRFTILAPHQARRARRIGRDSWSDVSAGRIDPTRAYEQRLPSGRKISLFFYDGPISRAVAFEGLLSKAEHLVDRLTQAFSKERDWPQMVHIATDGESYGHHHRFGDMALAYALNQIESNRLAKLTNYGEYLEKHPPTHEVEIVEKTSWSCFHGIDRWWSNCGCNSGGHPGWNQKWRTPLRNALDWLRDSLAGPYENQARQFLKDAWDARNDYCNVIRDRTEQNLQDFFHRHAIRELGASDKTTVLKLLELQRHALLMYTSCGWFFDELSGIETIQVMQYAGRAAQLGDELFGAGLEAQFVKRLAEAKSNIPEHGDGQQTYEKFVRPAKVDWEHLGAHYGISSLFESYPDKTPIYCYNAERDDYQAFEAGKAKMAIGRIRVESPVIRESSVLSFGVLHFGDHNISCGVTELLGDSAYRTLIGEVVEPFTRADLPEVIRVMDRHLGEFKYSLRSLFRDEQRKILQTIVSSMVDTSEALYRQIYENHAPIMRFLTDLRIPMPKALNAAAEVILNALLRRALEDDSLDAERIAHLLQTAKAEGVALEGDTLEFAFRRNIERLSDQWVGKPTELPLLQQLSAAVSVIPTLPLTVNLWKVQNGYYEIAQRILPEMRERKDRGDQQAEAWMDLFSALGQRINVKI